MGGHAPPPSGGLDGAVRKILPGDHQVSMAIIGLYFSIFMITKLIPSKKAAVVEAAPVSSSTSITAAGDIPAEDSPEFEAWLFTGDNLDKYLA
eukprot:CAMPEP_0181307106 /NCGR_PEP_ID=MMETSP1101-20121128/10683_1 /TAXON_ID=46948 /ORGANISM="Rhodomonas abbreviata, Strain Caron Lab Isolate" /LENGTH=92 /DNA_ID=CAMNT_0023413261 /DNA_START=87 /DNA_END=365 /DNA_ORIENTATION=-